MNIFEHENTILLVETMLSLETKEECIAFLEDLMTSREIVSMGQRITVAKMLAQKRKYTEIEEMTGASSATIGRVNRCIQYGRGGYRTVLLKTGSITDEDDNDGDK